MDEFSRQTYWSFIQGIVSEYASIPKKLEIDEEGGYVGLVVGISNTVAQDRFQIIKSSPDLNHFIFEVNVGKSRIRHTTTLK